MRLPRPIQNSILLLMLVFAAQKVCAQLAPADDFFNGGAQLYISNNIPAALEKTEDGLKIYPNDDQQQSQQNSQDQKKSDEQKQNQADQQKQAEQQKSNGEKKENQNGENQVAAGQMTPEEAKRLLDAQKGDEQVLQMKPKDKPENQNRTVKDW
jgi:hypothetical protein